MSTRRRRPRTELVRSEDEFNPPQLLDAKSGVPRHEVMTLLELTASKTADMVVERQQPVMDRIEKIADGAQAQILSAEILHGNPKIGFPGFVKTTTDALENLTGRLSKVEDDARERTRVDEQRWKEWQEHQGRVARMLQRCMPVVVKVIDWKVLLPVCFTMLVSVLPSGSVRNFFIWLASLMHRGQ